MGLFQLSLAQVLDLTFELDFLGHQMPSPDFESLNGFAVVWRLIRWFLLLCLCLGLSLSCLVLGLYSIDGLTCQIFCCADTARTRFGAPENAYLSGLLLLPDLQDRSDESAGAGYASDSNGVDQRFEFPVCRQRMAGGGGGILSGLEALGW